MGVSDGPGAAFANVAPLETQAGRSVGLVRLKDIEREYGLECCGVQDEARSGQCVSPPAQAREIYICCRYPRNNTAELVLKLKPRCRSIWSYEAH